METKNLINTEAKEIYEAPVVEIVEVMVEEGVVLSPPDPEKPEGPVW